MWRRWLVLFVMTLPAWRTPAQWTGLQTPPSVRWHEYRTSLFRVIYPREADSLARQTALFLERYGPLIGRGLTYRPLLTPVILNTLNAVPNGYTALAPRRTEWHMTPISSLYFGSRPWYRDLAVHEYRHVIQFDAMNKGGIRLMRYLFGDIGQLVGMGLTYPLWFFEGDAVYTETVFDRAGRGRSGRFATPVKAIVSEYPARKRNYYDFYYQSYKTYYPSHYHLGYYMVAYLHRHPGISIPVHKGKPAAQNIWDLLVRDAARWSLITPFGLHIALKTRRHLSYRQLADSTWAELDSIWHIKPDFRLPSGSYGIPHEKSPWSNDVYAHPTAGGQVLFLRYGYDTPPTVMRWRPGMKKAEKIRQIPAYRFSAGGEWLAWIEYRSHPRWQNQVKGLAVLYHRPGGKRIYLNRHDRYTDIRLSPDGRRWAAVYYDRQMVPHLETGSTAGMQVRHDRAFPAFSALLFPRFDARGRLLFEGMTENRGTGLYRWDPDKSRAAVTEILPPTKAENREWPLMLGDSLLLWTSDRNGVNIWQKNLHTGGAAMLTQRPYEAFYPAGASGRLWFSDYRTDGFHLISIPYDSLQPHPASAVPPRPEHYFVETPPARPLHEADTAVRVQGPLPYKHWRQWFHPHSWMILALPGEDKKWNWGFGLLSNDLLNEIQWMVAGMYNGPRDHLWYADMQWQRWWPVIGMRWSDQTTPRNRYRSYRMYVQLPLRLSYDIYSARMNITAGWNDYRSLHKKFSIWDASVSYGIWRQGAYRDLQTPGLSLLFRYGYAPVYRAGMWSFRAREYWPGPARHDYFSLELGARIQSAGYPKAYVYSPFQLLESQSYRQVWRAEAAYEAPLLYPDLGWKRVFRLKRLRGGPVAGWAQIDRQMVYGAGWALTGDWNFLGFKGDVPLGVKWMYIWPRHQWAIAIINPSFHL